LAEIRHGLTDILFRYLRGGTEENHQHLSGDTVFRERQNHGSPEYKLKGSIKIKSQNLQFWGTPDDNEEIKLRSDKKCSRLLDSFIYFTFH